MQDIYLPIIEDCAAQAAKLKALNSPSPYVGNAIQALCSVQSNLKWELEHLEHLEAQNKAPAADPLQAGGSEPAA